MEDKDKLEQVQSTDNSKQESKVQGDNSELISVEKSSKRRKKGEVDLTEFENLSDDELYAKIQTEKLLRKREIRRISTIAGLCFAFVLALCVIVLAVVPVSLKPRCMIGGFSSVALYPGTTNGVAFDEDDEGYKEFMKYYDKAFSQPYISAIFSGSLLSYDIEEKCENVSNVLGSSGELITNNTYFVRLRYSQERVFTYQSGRQYKSNYYTSKWPDGKLTFTDVYFVVNQKAGFQKTEVYVVAKYPQFDKDGVLMKEPKEYLITITVKANTFAIYDNWQELTK